MVKFALGFVLGFVLIPAVLLLYATSGNVPVATSDAPLPFEQLIARIALRAKIRKEMPSTVPIQLEEPVLFEGVHIYSENCSMCHGLPSKVAPSVAKGMFPNPPQFFQTGRKATVHPAGEFFWKVKNGVRLSGMPAFSSSLSDNQIWQVSLLLINAGRIPARVQQGARESFHAVRPTKIV